MATATKQPPTKDAVNGSVRVEIFDQVYNLRGSDPDYISKLAEYVDTKMRAGRVHEDEWNTPTTMYGCNKLYCEHLRLAIYKIGWQQPDGTASGSTEDIAAAIDQATADGVDVINLSFSGSLTFVVDPVELAFMFAADAGVFAAASAEAGPQCDPPSLSPVSSFRFQWRRRLLKNPFFAPNRILSLFRH